MLRAEPVLLGAAGDEAVLDDDTGGGGDAPDVVELLAVPDRGWCSRWLLMIVFSV